MIKIFKVFLYIGGTFLNDICGKNIISKIKLINFTDARFSHGGGTSNR